MSDVFEQPSQGFDPAESSPVEAAAAYEASLQADDRGRLLRVSPASQPLSESPRDIFPGANMQDAHAFEGSLLVADSGVHGISSGEAERPIAAAIVYKGFRAARLVLGVLSR